MSSTVPGISSSHSFPFAFLTFLRHFSAAAVPRVCLSLCGRNHISPDLSGHYSIQPSPVTSPHLSSLGSRDLGHTRTRTQAHKGGGTQVQLRVSGLPSPATWVSVFPKENTSGTFGEEAVYPLGPEKRTESFVRTDGRGVTCNVM